MQRKYKVLVDSKFVAGMRNPGLHKSIMLTHNQAEQPLRERQIALWPVKKAQSVKAAESTKDSK